MSSLFERCRALYQTLDPSPNPVGDTNEGGYADIYEGTRGDTCMMYFYHHPDDPRLDSFTLYLPGYNRQTNVFADPAAWEHASPVNGTREEEEDLDHYLRFLGF